MGGMRRGAHRRRHWARAVVLATAATVVLGASGATYALWSDHASNHGGPVVSGDMSLSVGQPTWRASVPGNSRTLAETKPEDIVSQPGDVVEVAIPVTARLRGDELRGAFSARLADPSLAQTGLDVSFHVAGADGVQVAPTDGSEATLGQATPVPGLTGEGGDRTTSWTVVVHITVRGDYLWAADGAAPDLPTWSVGSIGVDLVQVRGDADDAEGRP